MLVVPWPADNYYLYVFIVRDIVAVVQVWGYLGAEASGRELQPDVNEFPDPVVNNTGANYRSYENNTMTVLLTGQNKPVDAGWGWNQQVSVISDPCPPEGCPTPGVVVVKRDSNIR